MFPPTSKLVFIFQRSTTHTRFLQPDVVTNSGEIARVYCKRSLLSKRECTVVTKHTRRLVTRALGSGFPLPSCISLYLGFFFIVSCDRKSLCCKRSKRRHYSVKKCQDFLSNSSRSSHLPIWLTRPFVGRCQAIVKPEVKRTILEKF